MTFTTEELYDALYRIGSDDGTADGLPTDIIAQLVAFKIAETGDDGEPHLTPYGDNFYMVMESGNGRVTEFE